MGNVSVTLLLFVIMFFWCNRVTKVSALLAKKTHVYISNQLEPGKVLTVHCRSKDDNLGEHHLAFTQEYTWSFHTNIFDTTLFWCYFAWQNSSGKWVTGSYDIYKAKRDEERCGSKCHWMILEMGLYFLNKNTGIWENSFNWPSN